MSILIKNMEMPKDCPMCPLSHWDFAGEFRGCKAVNGKRYAMETEPEYFDSNYRPPWCPLVELPPHGRLIDADEFLDRAIGTQCFRGDYALMLVELVGESTTIIEAEGKK